MNIASVFDWFARESLHAADQTDDLKQREIFLRLAWLWTAAAPRSREEASTQSTTTGTGNERAGVITIPGACGLFASRKPALTNSLAPKD